MAICGQLASAKEYAYDAMAAERILRNSLKLLAFLFTIIFIIQDNIIIFKKQDPCVPQTVSTSLEVLGLASHSTLRPNGRFKSRTRRFLALRVQYTVKEKIEIYFTFKRYRWLCEDKKWVLCIRYLIAWRCNRFGINLDIAWIS